MGWENLFRWEAVWQDPVGFCDNYARAAWELLGPRGSFIEVFSGPDAPLSHALGRLSGAPVPGRVIRRQGPRGKQRADEVSTVDSSERPIVRDPREEGQSCMPDQPRPHGGGEQTTRVREESAAHPRRPWGPADPPRESSYTLKHPYSESDTVKGDHFNALAAMNQLPESINRARLARLGEWKRLSTPWEILALQRTHEKKAGANAVRLGRKPRTALMEHLGRQFRAVPTLCLTGMPIVGPALESPFFEEFDVPAQITVEEFVASAPKRRVDNLKRVKTMARAGSPELAQAIWEKTLKEVQGGTNDGRAIYCQRHAGQTRQILQRSTELWIAARTCSRWVYQV